MKWHVRMIKQYLNLIPENRLPPLPITFPMEVLFNPLSLVAISTVNVTCLDMNKINSIKYSLIKFAAYPNPSEHL